GAELIFAMINPRLAARAAILYRWPDVYIAGVLEKSVQKARWRGISLVRAETWHAESVSDALADYADQNDIDYIVIGAGNCAGLQGFLKDSIARELPDKANCPVLLVNHLRNDAPAKRRGLRRLFFHNSAAPARLPVVSWRSIAGRLNL